MEESSDTPVRRSQPSGVVNVGGELWLSVGEVAFLGEARIALLEQIAAQGSITRAAKAAGMSYKAAWDAVDAMNNLAPKPVVATATGGRGGGGARLTAEGRRLIDAYRTIAVEYQRFLDNLNAALGDPQASLEVLRRLALRTSARNQFIGRIVSVTVRTVDAEVEIAIQGDQRIVAGLTNESVEQLGLRPGRRVWALVKAVAVSVQREPVAAAAAGARTNQLCGVAQRIVRGDGPVEVSVALGAGVTVRGVTATDELEALGIQEGGPTCAVFPASSVIVGVDD
ncbi:MAG: LysR family transcriptional regulator [Gammaproteobacteria bacterium]|jgi:molybdate transport system regulatory protein|nr:LysR family transcriptional regulator [Gammaproteobacteria bacterium]